MIEIRLLAAASLLAMVCAPLAPATAQQVALQQSSETPRVVPEPPRRPTIAEIAVQEVQPARTPIYVLLGVGF